MFFNKDGVVDEIEIMVEDVEVIDDLILVVFVVVGSNVIIWIWWDGVGVYLWVLIVEDNVMFILMSIFVLIVVMNIIFGLVMLVKNKGWDIGILCMMGIIEGLILCIFFICGVGIGMIVMIFGVIFGCLFVIYIELIFSFINFVVGGGVWDFNICGIYEVFVLLWVEDVIKVLVLLLGLLWVIIILLVCCVVCMNLVEVLCYE